MNILLVSFLLLAGIDHCCLKLGLFRPDLVTPKMYTKALSGPSLSNAHTGEVVFLIIFGPQTLFVRHDKKPILFLFWCLVYKAVQLSFFTCDPNQL